MTSGTKVSAGVKVVAYRGRGNFLNMRTDEKFSCKKKKKKKKGNERDRSQN